MEDVERHGCLGRAFRALREAGQRCRIASDCSDSSKESQERIGNKGDRKPGRDCMKSKFDSLRLLYLGRSESMTWRIARLDSENE